MVQETVHMSCFVSQQSFSDHHTKLKVFTLLRSAFPLTSLPKDSIGANGRDMAKQMELACCRAIRCPLRWAFADYFVYFGIQDCFRTYKANPVFIIRLVDWLTEWYSLVLILRDLEYDDEVHFP